MDISPNFFSAKSPSELSSSSQRALFHAWNLLALLVSSALITVLSLLLGLGMLDIEFFFD